MNHLITKAQRRERWVICAEYLKQHTTLDAARQAALKDGKSFSTSVWITAFGKLMDQDDER